MGTKAWLLFAVLAAGILGPLGQIWEMWHRTPSVCAPCAGLAGRRLKAATGTCGSFTPMLNATCPACGALWWDRAAPEDSPTQRLFAVLPKSRVPTVFSEPRICAMEGVYFRHLWRAGR